MRRSFLVARVLLAVGACLAAATLPSCGEGDSKPVVAPKRDRKDEVATFTQILIGYRTEKGPQVFTRSKQEAQKTADEVLAQLQGGAPMEALIDRHTDDRGDDGKPFNRGSYTIARRASPAMEVVKKAVFSVSPGSLVPRVIDTGVAFLLVRRDA